MILDTFRPWFLPLGVVAVSIAAGYLARAVFVHKLARLSARTETHLDDLLLASCRRHIPLWFVLGGVALAARTAPLSSEHAELIGKLAAALGLLSLSFAAAGFAGGLVARTAQRGDGSFASTSLTRNVLRTAILAFGALLVLDNLGVDVTPLLTALGVGSLAVALALQPTLSNLIAGLHITLAKPVRVGDFVEIEGGTSGFIADVGWRATRIRELSNNMIVVPNARLAEMVVKNYTMPEPEQSVVIQVGVSYGSDLARVERVTCEVAKEILGETPGGVGGFEPFIRYHTFGESSIGFSVILRVREFVDRYLVTHEFVKRLKARYDREGIEIPFPQRVLHGPAAPFARLPGSVQPDAAL